MEKISLEQAVREIHGACHQCHEQGKPSPFLLVTGAGVSYPAVPLASTIIERCQEKIRQQGGEPKPPDGNNPMSAYSFWMAQAFPHPFQRREFLAGLIDERSISPGNLRLAHLLLAEDPEKPTLTNLVITTNFDDHLSRALRIFGKLHVVCDHPATTFRIEPDSDKLQLVHVHGTHQYYDCTNLDHEIEGVAGAPAHIRSMSGLIGSLLRSHCPIVIGYGGWGQDVLMRKMSERLTERLPANLYWFCYSWSDWKDLQERWPEELLRHPDMRVVLPELPDGDVDRSEAGALVAGESKVATQPAQKVFEAMLQRFGCEEPELFQDPKRFLADRLRETLPQEEQTGSGGLYSFQSVFRQLEERPATATERLVEEARKAVREARDEDLVAALEELTRQPDVDEHEQELRSFFERAFEAVDRSAEEGKWEEAAATAERLLSACRRLEQSSSGSFRPELGTALHKMGRQHGRLGRREEALEATREAVDIFRELARTRPDAFRADLARSLNNLGMMLSALGRREEALEATLEAVDIRRELARTRPDAFRPDLARSLNNLGIWLSDLGRREGALEATREAVDIHRDLARTRPDAYRPYLARSLSNLGNMLSNLGRREEALEDSQEAVDLYRDLDCTRPDAFRPGLARSLNNLGKMLSDLGRREEALEATEEAVEIYRDLARTRPDAFRPDLASSLNNLGIRLSGLGRREEAIAAAREAVVLLLPFFERLPTAFAPQMRNHLDNYLERCQEAGQEPDAELIRRAEAVFQSLQAQSTDPSNS